MEYPMPDNMGFTRRGIMDMLPEEIAEADMAAMRRHVQREGLGMKEHTCAGCGCTFVANAEHRFKRVIKTKKGAETVLWCSYRCFRPIEREEEEKYRRRVLGAWVAGDNRAKSPVEMAKDRVKRCREGLRKAERKAQSVEWSEMSAGQRYRLNRRIAGWRAKLLLAEMELEEAMAGESAGGVRGVAGDYD